MIEKYKPKILAGWARLVELNQEWADKLEPSRKVRRGAALAALLTSLILLGIYGIDLNSGLGVPVDILLAALIAFGQFAAYYIGALILLDALKQIPPSWAAAGAVSVYGITYFLDLGWELTWPYTVGIVLIEMLIGGLIAWMRAGGWQAARVWKRGLAASLMILAIGANIALVVWFFDPGSDDHLLKIDPARGKPNINAPDPSQPGEYTVNTLTYGSGTDLRRPEYGAGADLITQSVDVGWFITIKDDYKGKIRNRYWGFDEDDFPLNGRVWYPEGEGRFPLVLIVHGNHNMNDYSDTGYAYLGKLLASRGYIVVSIDQNFFNGYLSGGISGANDGRGWMLLKHLEVWQSWNINPDTPFFGRVDMDKIALIGHSRGGEAAVHAALFNTLDYYPNNANVSFNFNFGIKSVIAIAPTDQQYKPADHPASLIDINYLTIAGAHDGDVSTFVGMRQYNRIYFTDNDSGQFKAGLYIYQANHGQFNTSWGRRDESIPLSYILNTKPLMPGDEQRQVAKVYISAFLDATLKGATDYVPLFIDHRLAGDWLPPTLYINQYEDGSYQKLATYEEDPDLTSATVPGGKIAASGLTRWREEEMEFRTGRSMENQAVILRWNNYVGQYTLTLPDGLAADWGLGAEDTLVFSLADRRDDDLDTLLDFSIILKDSQGETASIPISYFGELLPQFQAQFTRFPKWEADEYENPSEPIFQSFRIPLSAFIAANPALALDAISEVIFSFDQVEEGEIYLDDLGFGLD